MNKLSLFVVLVALYLPQCKKNTDIGNAIAPVTSLYTTNTGSNPALNKNYLALGDSYTIGQSVDSVQRFPSQTIALLRNMGVAINSPDYIATTGWTTDDLDHSISNNYPIKRYDLVTLLIGVNDQYQTHDTTGYRLKFQRLLNIAIDLANNNNQHVIVLSIPDYSVTPFAHNYDTAQIRKEIDWFNTINKDVTSQRSCSYLDITPSTREALNDPTLTANDGLHPSGKEYLVWAQGLSQICYPFLR